MMKYYAISVKEMTSEHLDRWLSIQRTHPFLLSPYFHPSFTRAVASVRKDVCVGILEADGKAEGFFPFQRSRGKTARPVGLGLSDYQGIIAPPELEFSAEELLRGFGLKRWDFDHLLSGQKQFSPYHSRICDSPVIDVSEGFDVFLSKLDSAGRKQFKETQRKYSKLEEQVGSVSFSLHSERKDILQKLIQWKSEQCRRTGTIDYFSIEWCVSLINLLHVTREDDFGGMLSCLHAGDTLAAVHFGMYTPRVWHSWFPAYNHHLEEYSPGSILLYEIIKEAAGKGVRYIDLGKGVSLYKRRVMTGAVSVAEGRVFLPSFSNSVGNLKKNLEGWAKSSFLKPILRIPGRIIKRIERESRFK